MDPAETLDYFRRIQRDTQRTVDLHNTAKHYAYLVAQRQQVEAQQRARNLIPKLLAHHAQHDDS